MATIYYWAANTIVTLSNSYEPPRVGHLSLGLDDGTYISHWPTREFSLKKRGMGWKTILKPKEENPMKS